jgi:sn-glycerol 3-phosphate transport system substrate-binding protein
LLAAAVAIGAAHISASAADKPKAKPTAKAKAAPSKPAAKAARPATPAAEPSAEIELVHKLGPEGEAQLSRLVERFNQDSQARIVLAKREWDAGTIPAMMILDETAEQRFLEGKPRYRPLHEVMKESGERMETLKPSPAMNPAPLDGGGKLLALPVRLSTPVMFYNRDAFKKVGLDAEKPPKTWFELQEALGKLADAGVACPYASSYPAWIHVENTSAWHNAPVAGGTPKQEGPLAINGMIQVKHLSMMSSWYKSRYLHIFGRGSEADAKFASGECAVLTSASGSYPALVRDAKFEVGVAALPYHDDIPGAPQNTLADGPSLWVAAGRTRSEYETIGKFVAFLLTPESQVELQRHAGSLPLNRAGLLASTSDQLKSEMANIRVAVATLTNKPATPASAASRYAHRADVRAIVDEELDALWANRKPAKQVLDEAVARSRSLK